MAWTNLSFAYGSVLTSTKMTQMYDNFAYGAGSTNPTFLAPALGTVASGDLSACTSNTESVGNNSTQLATTAFCEAGFVNNDVTAQGIGCILGTLQTNTGSVASGATCAGSFLKDDGGLILSSGTWRNIGPSSATTTHYVTFQRIS